MGDLEVPPSVVPFVSNLDHLTLHHMIKASGEYNFKQCQVTIKSHLNPDAWDELLQGYWDSWLPLLIKSQLNPDTWDELLQGYWDSQLPLLIRFGLPLDFDRNIPLESHPENQNSAKNYPSYARVYLEVEKMYNTILGPFDAPPLANLHTSHFMTRENPSAKNRRVIVDLSIPQGKICKCW